MRNLILAVVVAGLAAGTATAAEDAAPAAAADKPAAAPEKSAAEGWQGDHFGAAPTGVTVHRGEGPARGGWADSAGNPHRYGEWHGGGPGDWRGGWAGGWRPDYGAYPHGYNVQIIPGDYAYRRFTRGGTVPPLWRDDRFYVREWFAFGLTEPSYGYRWIRYYNDALLIDVRYNGGGHVSGLLLQKLARRRLGYDFPRWGAAEPYPSESPRGPMVALTNELAGSDGDIFSHAFKMLKLGPLIGKRTWGGVVGITPRHRLADGTVTTQPEYAFTFDDVGWAVENYGTDPDIDIDNTPADYAAGRDPQLDRAIAEALARIDAQPPHRAGPRPGL